MRQLKIAAAVALLLVSLLALAYALSASSERVLGYSATVLLILAFTALGVLISRQRERIHNIERALSRSRIRSQAIVEASPDGIVLARGTRIVRTNPAFRALLAIPPDEEILGRDLLSLVAEESREGFEEWLTKRQAGAVEPERLEFSGMRQSGSRVSLEACCARVPSREGRQVALFLRDLSSRKTLEFRARHLVRLETLADAASEFIEEFEKVFMVIRSLSRREDGDPRQHLYRIDRAATRGAALSRRVRALTPAEIETSDCHPMDLSQLLREVSADYMRSLPGSITLRYAGDDSQPAVVVGEATQLRQAIWHLLENAAQAQQEGEVQARVRRIDLDAAGSSLHPGSHAGPYTVVEIRDSGPGMDEKTRARAFSPFFTTKGQRASGLGLTLVFGIVRAHGGFVELDSKPGQGTVARLAIPSAPGDVVAASSGRTPPRSEDAWRGRETILAVDDDTMALREYGRILERFGYLVEVASTPREALQRLRKKPPVDLVLLDMVLPGWNGPDVLQRIVRNWPGQRVVMVSPYPLPEQEDLALSHGAVGLYLKPLTSPSLAHSVREGLDQPPPASMLTGPL